MNKYIMVFEDGNCYVADKITPEDKFAVADGILTVIRCSDQKELVSDGDSEEWKELADWETTNG